MAIFIEIGQALDHDGKKYIASAVKHGLCDGCDFRFFTGEHNECHAPDGLYCDHLIFKETETEVQPVYEQDHFFDYDYDFDTTGVVVLLSAIGATIGAALAATGTAIYYLIIYLNSIL